MAEAKRDQNYNPTLLGVSNVDGSTTVPLYADPVTHRLLVDLPSSGGTVTSVSVVSANGLAGTVATATTTPAITLSTTVNSPVLAGNGTAISAATTTGTGSTVVLSGSPALTTPSIAAITVSGGILTLPTGATDTLVSRNSTDTLTNKTLTSPTLVTPALGTPSSGTVTNLTGTASININGTVGATTPAAVTGTTIQANTGFQPDANDGAFLGTSALGFSDLFLAEGAVINWDNGDATLTQAGDTVTLAGADLLVTTVGTAATSVATLQATQTLTSKRITKRTGTTTSSATPTINTDNVDEYYITAQAEAITSFTTNLSGTPTLGQLLFISIIGTGARAITWGASFANGPEALPTTTVTTTQLSTLLKWDGSIWRCYATGSTV